MEDIIVLGIDPAPKKGAMIFDGEKFISKDVCELKKYIENCKNINKKLLICWDAPLTTGNLAKGVSVGKKSNKKYSHFYWRPLEYMIAHDMDKKPPNGISTLGYAGCSHWVITQYCIGLPKVYEHAKNPDFTLIMQNNDKKDIQSHGEFIIEVHPALALWCWIDNGKNQVIDWEYKKKKEVLHEIINKLKTVLEEQGYKETFPFENNKITIYCNDNEKSIQVSDDHLDAYIAWLLGRLWLTTDKMELVGDENTGAILLPKTEWTKTLADKLKV